MVLPYGTYKTSDELVYDTNPGVSIRGDGSEATVIWCNVDAGTTGSEFIARPDLLQAARSIVIEGINFRGPGTDTAYGTAPCQRSGLQIPSGATVSKCEATLCYAGFDGAADHWRLEHCNSTTNQFGLYLGKEINAEGDQTIIGCFLTGNKFASIGISASNSMDGVTITSTHLGYTPICIWKQDPDSADTGGGYAANNNGIVKCTFTDVAFENYAYGAIVAEDPAKCAVTDSVFIGCNAANQLSNDTLISGSPLTQDANVTAQSFSRNTVISSPGITGQGDVYTFSVSDMSDTRIVWRGAFSIDSGKRLVNDSATLAGANVIEDGRGRVGSIIRAVATIAANQLLYASTSLDRVSPYPTGSTPPPLGVAAHAATNGQKIVVWRRGPVSISSTDTGNLTAHNLYLKPDGSNAGQVVKASSFSDGPLVGYSQAGITSSLVPAWLQL
jgi:hypothetical protein